MSTSCSFIAVCPLAPAHLSNMPGAPTLASLRPGGAGLRLTNGAVGRRLVGIGCREGSLEATRLVCGPWPDSPATREGPSVGRHRQDGPPSTIDPMRVPDNDRYSPAE